MTSAESCLQRQALRSECLDGLVTITLSMEIRSYIIPQYPTLCVKLLHVVVDDKGKKFVCFLDDQKLPEIPGEVYVENGLPQ